MTVKKWKHSGTKKHSMSDREIRNGLLSEKAAEEGIVLLKNDKKILPLNISTKIGLYGAGAGKTVKGGTGSGDVNNRSNISIYQGLKENGIQIVSEKWLANYESIYAEARRAWKEKILEEAKFVENPFDAYTHHSRIPAFSWCRWKYRPRQNRPRYSRRVTSSCQSSCWRSVPVHSSHIRSPE